MTIKTLNYINICCFSITLILYTIGAAWGLIAQFFLGSIQIVFSIILSIRYKRLNRKSKTRLIIYLISTTIYLLVLGILIGLWDYLENLVKIIDKMKWVSIAIIPMILSSYFVFTTYKIYQEN